LPQLFSLGGEQANAQAADNSQAIRIDPKLAAAVRLRFFRLVYS